MVGDNDIRLTRKTKLQAKQEIYSTKLDISLHQHIILKKHREVAGEKYELKKTTAYVTHICGESRK